MSSTDTSKNQDLSGQTTAAVTVDHTTVAVITAAATGPTSSYFNSLVLQSNNASVVSDTLASKCSHWD